MDWFWWTLTLAVMAIGLIGTLLPLVPGTAMILAAAVAHHLLLGPAKSAGWGVLFGLLVLTLLSQAVDFISGAAGAKWFGATRLGAIGGIVGSIVGLFFGLIGILIGPLLGVLAGELLGGKGLVPAGKSTWGTIVGTTAGILGKFAIGLLMIGWFLVAALAGHP